jgi:hypothetical protein
LTERDLINVLKAGRISVSPPTGRIDPLAEIELSILTVNPYTAANDVNPIRLQTIPLLHARVLRGSVVRRKEIAGVLISLLERDVSLPVKDGLPGRVDMDFYNTADTGGKEEETGVSISED